MVVLQEWWSWGTYTLAVLLMNIWLVCATTFRSRYGTELQWTPNVMTAQSNIESLIECASLCAIESEICGGFMYPSDNGSCILANHVVSCPPRSPDANEGLLYYTTQSEGPTEELAPSSQEFTYVLASALEKSNWTATASASFNDRSPDLVIDGADSGLNFATGAGALHSWLQIDMGETKWVKGGRMVSNNGLKQMYTEVRVGDQDVEGSLDDKILCQNHLCYRTDNEQTIPLSFDCKDPLKGRFMTLQKYDNYPGDYNYVDLFEVDIEVYCGPTKEADAACQADQSVDMCANRDLITENTELATTAAQKSDWTIQYSTLYPPSPYPEKVIDGIQLAGDNTQLFCSDTGDYRPWLQLDIAQSRIVKAVHIYAKYGGGQGWYTQYIEVRVGDTDAAATATVGQRICDNTLCKTTVGAHAIREEKSDCAGGVPIQGRYVTIQRFKYLGAGKEYLNLAEVDIEFYI